MGSPSMKALVACMLLASWNLPQQAAAQACEQTFMDALDGGDTWLLKKGLKLTGYADKLPDPSIGVTILAPSDGAWWRFLWDNGLFLRQLSSLGDKLTSVITFHVLPSVLPPDRFYNRESGNATTLYGLLTGQPAFLEWWMKDDGSQFLFQGPWDDTVAGVTDVIQVCNSWIFIVDEVLKPAYDLSDVQKVEIPDLNFGGGGGGSPAPSSPAPVPSSPTPEPSSPAPPPCDKTFAQVAGETSGLGLLSTVLAQEAYASALPDPAYPYTLFAPTDAAFFDLLSSFNLSITDALALGDKLNAVLLYHVVPGALTPEQLAQYTSLNTGLAAKTGDAAFSIAVNSAGGQTTVSGNYPGNTANLASNVAVCASQVYVVDKVLVPSGSLDSIPATSGGLDPPSTPTVTAASGPSPAEPQASPALAPAASPVPAPVVEQPVPAQVPATPAPAPASEAPSQGTLTGVALASGYLVGCNVQLVDSAGASQIMVTDTTGRFVFNCLGNCVALGGVMTLPAAGQPASCTDSLTKLPPPFDFQAPVSALPEGITLSAVSPLTTIIAAATAQQAAPQQPAAPAPAAGPTSRKLLQQQAVQPAAGQLEAKAAQQPAVLLEPIYGIAQEGSSGSGSSAVATSYGDALEAASAGGDLAAYNLLAANQELMCTGSIAGALLAELVGGPTTTSSVAAAALFDQLAQDLLQGTAFNLSDVATVQQLLQGALAALTAAATDGAPPAVDSAAIVQAAAGTISLFNGFLQQAVVTATEQQLAEADKMVQVLARLAKVCQATAAPAAAQLATGALAIDSWSLQFAQQAITDLAIGVSM